MAVTSIIEGVRTFVISCPLLDAQGRIGVDYLSDEPTEYSVDPIPSNIVTTSYIDGSTDRQFVFVFSSREPFGADVLQNMANSGFFEAFSDWLDTKNAAKQFPTLPTGKTPLRIYAADQGYAMESGTDSARYQIQCVLEYHQEGA